MISEEIFQYIEEKSILIEIEKSNFRKHNKSDADRLSRGFKGKMGELKEKRK